jgi:hypothetical protein
LFSNLPALISGRMKWDELWLPLGPQLKIAMLEAAGNLPEMGKMKDLTDGYFRTELEGLPEIAKRQATEIEKALGASISTGESILGAKAEMRADELLRKFGLKGAGEPTLGAAGAAGAGAAGVADGAAASVAKGGFTGFAEAARALQGKLGSQDPATKEARAQTKLQTEMLKQQKLTTDAILSSSGSLVGTA